MNSQFYSPNTESLELHFSPLSFSYRGCWPRISFTHRAARGPSTDRPHRQLKAQTQTAQGQAQTDPQTAQGPSTDSSRPKHRQLKAQTQTAQGQAQTDPTDSSRPKHRQTPI